ncbi:hypothetical protein SAMN04488574_10565 [Bacillus sp. 71mf]|uniref:hypothetical protein n=2 Tax=unclassified Bacillus (in: firmicutes) TaxID=185979 RepID=UPI0008E55D96|nr:hypothetical protein [Bacillus sp. 103mf]SFI90616.1 hypothetical protein SAMN04488574_10565 [Bacillus sp. 71mf]SFS66372.1 hypothetical protein SAMN04488145_102253 [Bacillus sp. 103mf]
MKEGATTVVAAGLAVFTEGVKWDVDLDVEDGSIKDMVKTGSKKSWSTVAGWFNEHEKKYRF